MLNTCLCKEARYGPDIHALRLQVRSSPPKPLSMQLRKNRRRCEASGNSRLQSRSAILLRQMQARRTHSFWQAPVLCRSAYIGRLMHSSTFYSIQLRKILYSVLRVVVEEGTGACRQSAKTIRVYSSHVSAAVVFIISVDHHSTPSRTARISAFFMELLTPSTPFSSA